MARNFVIKSKKKKFSLVCQQQRQMCVFSCRVCVCVVLGASKKFFPHRRSKGTEKGAIIEFCMSPRPWLIISQTSRSSCQQPVMVVYRLDSRKKTRRCRWKMSVLEMKCHEILHPHTRAFIAIARVHPCNWVASKAISLFAPDVQTRSLGERCDFFVAREMWEGSRCGFVSCFAREGLISDYLIIMGGGLGFVESFIFKPL
jgi:hypothetical protein